MAHGPCVRHRQREPGILSACARLLLNDALNWVTSKKRGRTLNRQDNVRHRSRRGNSALKKIWKENSLLDLRMDFFQCISQINRNSPLPTPQRPERYCGHMQMQTNHGILVEEE